MKFMAGSKNGGIWSCTPRKKKNAWKKRSPKAQPRSRKLRPAAWDWKRKKPIWKNH
jgi:hypothetical protein